jgi:hypothetical protein
MWISPESRGACSVLASVKLSAAMPLRQFEKPASAIAGAGVPS